MNKIFTVLLLITGLFSDCKIDMIVANSSAENAVDYALKGNHKYALIEIEEAITYTKQAIDSCKFEEVDSQKIKELSKNLSSLLQTREKIMQKFTPERAEEIIRSVHPAPYKPDTQQMNGIKKIEVFLEYYIKGTLTYFKGKTNLPEKTKIGIQLNDRASDFKIYVKEDGSFESAGFGDMGSVLHGKYKVDVLIYNNQSWQTKDIMEKLNKYYGYGSKKEGHATITKIYHF